MFWFFLQSHRKGILTFSGTIVDVEYDPNGHEGKMTFRKFDNGDYRNIPITTKHPNIVYSVIKGKKSWGLWLNQWTDGIVDWTFTLDEIVGEFHKHNIEIPEPLMNDFMNVLYKKKMIRNDKYLSELSTVINGL